MERILLFLLRCGFDSRLCSAPKRPSFSDIDDTRSNIAFVMLYGGLYSAMKASSIINLLIILLIILAYFTYTYKAGNAEPANPALCYNH